MTNRILLASILVLVAACASTTPPSAAPAASGDGAPRPTCAHLAEMCHAHDDHGGTARECHLLGHDPKSTEAMCSDKRDACMAACPH